VDIRSKGILAFSAMMLVVVGGFVAYGALQPDASVQPAPPTDAQTTVSVTIVKPPSPEKDRMTALILAAVEDRNSGILDAPPASKRLADGDSTAGFQHARTRDAAELASRAKRLKHTGFWYVGTSSTVDVRSIVMPLDRSYAVATFNELTELRIASKAGPSDVPEMYSLDQTARFVATENGWQLSEIGLGDTGPKGLLPSTIVASQAAGVP